MIQKIIFFTLLIFPVTAYCQPTDCYRFREGRFSIADTRAGAIIIADRKGFYQTESSETLKLIIRFRITWQDNCTYTLRLDKIIRNENKIDIPSGMMAQVKIIETARNSYTQETTSSISNGTYKVAVSKID